MASSLPNMDHDNKKTPSLVERIKGVWKNITDRNSSMSVTLSPIVRVPKYVEPASSQKLTNEVRRAGSVPQFNPRITKGLKKPDKIKSDSDILKMNFIPSAMLDGSAFASALETAEQTELARMLIQNATDSSPIKKPNILDNCFCEGLPENLWSILPFHDASLAKVSFSDVVNVVN